MSWIRLGFWTAASAVVTSCHGFIGMVVSPPCDRLVGSICCLRMAENLDDAFFPIHHTAIKTRNMTVALDFYSLLGFEPLTKFKAGPAKAAWLEQSNAPPGSSGSRLELIEIPSHLLNEPQGQTYRAPDLIQQQTILGQNHLALDVTSSIQRLQFGSLAEWLECLNQKSITQFGKTLRIAVEPYQTMIGKGVYELAFLYDADGALIELLHKQTELQQDVSSGWDPTEKVDFDQ